MANILYTLIIFPIEQVIEICFSFLNNKVGSPGIAILGVSVAVSTAILPIYLMADAQQRRQREIEKGLEKRVRRIKSVFKGDEQFMLLSTYYRQNNYHPIYALRNSIDLLIQIPFFIAAYHFLSHLEILKGASFLFINDLGAPDKLLGGVNVLPFAMTVINVVSGMIYAKGLKSKDKVQLYAMAGVFLVLLYNSPAGLVLYWTSNNIYNLVKNVIQNVIINKLPKRESSINNDNRSSIEKTKDCALNDNKTFVFASIALALLVGLVIPSGVISSSVDVFSFATSDDPVSPLRFVVHTMLQASGFLLWGLCLFFLFQKKTKCVLTVAVVSVLIMAIMGTFVFQGNYGFLLSDMVLSNYVKPNMTLQGINIAAIIASSIILYFLMSIRRKHIIISLLFITFVSFVCYGVTHIVKINDSFESVKTGNTTEDKTVELPIKLSKHGKNVIVFMMDRAHSIHIPYIFDEKPELRESFRDFTFYPNKASFGYFTQVGAPALFGGYHYSPDNIQRRPGLLEDKYNEAFQVLPRIMAQNDFDVVVANLPFANNNTEEFAKQIFGDDKNITAVDLLSGKYINSADVVKLDYNLDMILQKNLFQFSLFKCLPYIVRGMMYNNGHYMNADPQKYRSNYSKAVRDNYLSLLSYPQNTDIKDDGRNRSFIAVSEITHEPYFLQYPQYELVSVVTNKGSGILANNPYYHANMLGFKLFARWLDHLRDSGVWDNTRIVLVSDHGTALDINDIPENITLPNGDKLQKYCGMLLVKDFDVDRAFNIDSTFMTAGDVPQIAVSGLIENPINPFTKQPLYTDKDSGILVVSDGYTPWEKQGRYMFKIKDNDWLKVNDNVYIKENWSKYQFVK